MNRAGVIRWKPAEGEGIEHLEFRREGDCVTARSVVVGARGGVPYGLGYRIELADDWRVRRVKLSLTDGTGLELAAQLRMVRTDTPKASFPSAAICSRL